MKQKLPEKKFLYKNLYLVKIRKTKILSKSRAQSLIRLLIAKFFNKQKIINSVEFRLIPLSIDPFHLRKKKNFILNILIFFGLPLFIFFFGSNRVNIIEKKIFNLAKVQKQDYSRKEYIGIYKKSFQNLNQNFDIFLQNIFEKKKLSENESFSGNMNHITYLFNSEKLRDSFEKEKTEIDYGLNSSTKFLEFHFFVQEMKNIDYIWLRKEILQNLQNWGEFDEILVKASFLLKEKDNSYFSNYIKFYLWQLFTTNFDNYEREKPEIFTKKTIEYFYSEFNNPKICTTFENILSDAIYNYSRYLLYKTKEYDFQKINKESYYTSSNKNEEIILGFFKFINLNKFHNLPINRLKFDRITKFFHLRGKQVSRPVFIKQIFSNKSFSLLRNKSKFYLNFLMKSLKNLNNKYLINNLFSKQEKKINSKFLFFFESLLINQIGANTVSTKKLNKNLQNIENNSLKNMIESDDIKIISWKIGKYHSNFLLNYSLPFNLAYNINFQTYSSNNKLQHIIKKDSLFLKIFNLPKLFNKTKKTLSLISCIQLKEYLIIRTNHLDLLMDNLNVIEDPNFILNTRSNNETNELVNNFLLIENFTTKFTPFYRSIRNIYHRYCNKLLNNAIFGHFNSLIISEKLIIYQKYSIPLKENVKKSFISNFNNGKYQKLNFKVDQSLYKIKNLSKNLLKDNFLIKLKLIEILKNYFKISDLKNMNKISNSLQIFTNISNINVKQNQLLNTNKYIKQIFLKNLKFTENDINNSIINFFNYGITGEIEIHLLTLLSIKNNLLKESIKNEKLLLNSNDELNFDKFLMNYGSNYEETFLFYSKKNNNENKNSIIYFQFLKNILKYNKINQIFLKKQSVFFEKKISQLIQLKLNKFSFNVLNAKFRKTKIISFGSFYKKLSQQYNFYSSTNSNFFFPIQEKNKIQIIFRNKRLDEKRISTHIIPDLNITKIKNYYKTLQSKALTRNLKINSSIFQSLNKIYIYPISNYSEFQVLENVSENGELKKNTEIYNKSNQIELFNFFEKDIFCNEYDYTSWFFTSEWWEYNIHILKKTLRKRFFIISSYFEYIIDNNIQIIKKTLVTIYRKRRNVYTSNSKWNSRLFFDYTSNKIYNFVWSDFQFINELNNLHWAILSLTAFILVFYQNYFSIFIGCDSIDSWKHFEAIKYLADTSRAFYFTQLLHRNKTQLNKTENLFIYFFSNLKHYAKNSRFYLLTKKNLNKLLKSNKSLDLSRRKRNLLVQSLITPTRIREYGFHAYSKRKPLNNQLFGYSGNPQQGLSYLRYLAKMLKKDVTSHSLYLADKWIFFASLQKIISSQTLQQTKTFNSNFQKIPIPLQLGLSCSKGILLIGSVETGRSYLIKNFAAESNVPLLGISINKLMYNKPDIITESWMNILIESLRRLNLILDLAKGMSPCIIWIQNIHQLNVNRLTQNIESDPTFLLGILLKHFQTNSLKNKTKNNIIMIGSTHLPKKVDPSLISPDRLDRIINLRLFNNYQRKKQFPILLNRNNLQLKKNLLHFNELGSRTMGYNLRDLSALSNEISLISITKNNSFIYDDVIRLAFHRQVLGFSHINNKPNYQHNFKTLLYKVGRAIIQNILIENYATNPLNISNFLWKRKFYYLSKWYSEPSMNDSIIKESTILIHILSCLAGIAARDSWFLLEKDSNTSISLDKLVENDLDLAFSILETFSSDFPWFETCNIQNLDYKKEKSKFFLTKNFLNIMHNGIFAIANKSITNIQNNSQFESLISKNTIKNKQICEFNNTAWSPRFWRLSFSRSHLFNWIKRPNEVEFSHTFRFSKKKNLERKQHSDQLIGKKKEQLFYERILPRVRKRNVEELESQFEDILLEEQLEILGFFGSPTDYQMEYQLDNKPRLFIGKRILWDPIGSFDQIRHFVFSRRDFFIDEEMLRRLYITYGVRRERERSLSSHRIKKFFIHRGYNKDLINKLSIRWWNQLPIDQKYDIDTLKRIERIGIRLKRPQIFTPVYLYQRWLIENIPGKFSRLDLLTHRDRWLKINTLLLNDSFTYNIILESYQYLFEFFLSNKILLNKITKMLLTKKWIFQSEIRDILYNIKNTESSNK